jgi:3-hydroxymyristoyl/3-hydroxydecanoyl-(acyl carrier protein) dehydratase
MHDNSPPAAAGMKQALTNAISGLSASPDGHTITATFEFPAGSDIFRGHFPDMPVIPAVYQVAVCREAVERCGPYKLAGISKSRFSKMCGPATPYSLTVSFAQDGSGAQASCAIHEAAGGALCSKIVLLFTKA